jgi:hypothetical protein
MKWSWIGGNRAVRQITEACRAKGADVISGGVVNWSGKDRDSQIDDIVRRMSVFG